MSNAAQTDPTNLQQQQPHLYPTQGDRYTYDCAMDPSDFSQNDFSTFPSFTDDGNANFFGTSQYSFDQDNNDNTNPLLLNNPFGLPSPSRSSPSFNQLKHINPASMWLGSGSSSSVDQSANHKSSTTDTAEGVTKGGSSSVNQRYGQLTPPDGSVSIEDFAGPSSDRKDRKEMAGDKRASGASGGSSNSKRRRKDSGISSVADTADDAVEDDDVDGNGTIPHGSGDKREKYREKNRVAAAKCRAKKKEHVDDLEDSHRTQSVLNTALRQTEQSLRDELSYWRTQALQHGFCECQAIQDYNIRKARDLAADKCFGGTDSGTRQPVRQSPLATSPVSSVSSKQSQHGSSVSVASVSPRMSSKGSSVLNPRMSSPSI